MWMKYVIPTLNKKQKYKTLREDQEVPQCVWKNSPPFKPDKTNSIWNLHLEKKKKIQ